MVEIKSDLRKPRCVSLTDLKLMMFTSLASANLTLTLTMQKGFGEKATNTEKDADVAKGNLSETELITQEANVRYVCNKRNHLQKVSLLYFDLVEGHLIGGIQILGVDGIGHSTDCSFEIGR